MGHQLRWVAITADGLFGISQVQVNQAGDLTLITAPMRDDPQSQAAVQAVGTVRDDYVAAAFPQSRASDVEVLVGGVGLSFLLLTVAFRWPTACAPRPGSSLARL